MRDVFAAAAKWLEVRSAFAMASLVDVRDAAPAPLGASMAVSSDGTIVGDIGAGCYESDIVEAAIATSIDGTARVLDLDLRTEDPVLGSNGCGGFLRVVAWRPDRAFVETATAIVAGRHDECFTITYRVADQPRAFTARFPARRALIVVGGTALAQEIGAIGARLDFRTVVVDPRPAFATPERLSAVDEIVVGWPDDVLPSMLDARTPLLVISHDPKIDIPALHAGLRSAAPYIGLLGSRRAQAGRRAALRADGVNDAAIARIHGPVGLDLGGVTTAETAVSILSELVAHERGRSGGSLVRHGGAIHNQNEGARRRRTAIS